MAQSRIQRVHLDGSGKPKAVDFERIRERFFSAAIRFYAATTDEARERARDRVLEEAYGLEKSEIVALSEAAKLRVAGRGSATSPMIAGPTAPGRLTER